jgi:hypothetical protein
VTDDAKEVVAVGQLLVGAAALRQQITIRGVTLGGERARGLHPFVPDSLISKRTFVAKDVVFDRALFQDRRAGCGVRPREIDLLVGLVSGGFEHRVGIVASPLDNEVGVFGNRIVTLGQGPIRLVAFVAQALVGLFALGRILLVAARHAYIRDRSSPSIAPRNSSVVR